MSATVLYGHRVCSGVPAAVGPDRGNCIGTVDFERLLERIADHTPGSGWRQDLMQRRGGARAWVLLTFDDGYADLLTHALPRLEHHRVPCVIFVTTGFIDGELVAYESALAALIARARVLHCPDEGELHLADEAQRASAYERLRVALKPLGAAARRRYLDRLHALNPALEPGGLPEFLSWQQLRELDRHPLVTIGTHGRRHVMLSHAAPATVAGELAHSRRRLAHELGRSVDLLAYPYGAHRRLSRILARLIGYRLGFGTEPRAVSDDDDRMALPRIDIHDYLARLDHGGAARR